MFLKLSLITTNHPVYLHCQLRATKEEDRLKEKKGPDAEQDRMDRSLRMQRHRMTDG